MKKGISLLVSSILLTAMTMTACTGTTPEANNSSSNAATGSSGTGTTDTSPLNVRVMNVDFGEKTEGKLLQEEFIKRCSDEMGRPVNFSYEWVHIGDYAEKLKVVLISGDLPDIIGTFGLPYPDLVKYGDQNVVEELSQHKDIMPNYYKVLEGDPNSKFNAFTDEGKLYGFFNVRYAPDGQKGLQLSGAVNKDVFEKHSLEIPETLTEWYEAASALKKLYPNRYPMSMHEDYLTIDDRVYLANKTNGGRYYNGTEFVYGPTEDAYKESLIYMNRLFKEELISPDYVTFTSDKGTALVASGEAMMIPNVWWGYPGQWKTDYPDQTWIGVPKMYNEEKGTPWIFNRGPEQEWVVNNGYARIVSANSKIKDEAVRLLDILYSPSLIEVQTWGIKDVTYKQNADGKNEFLPEYSADQKKLLEIGHPASSQSRVGIFPELQNITVTFSLLPKGFVYYNGEMTETNTFDFCLKNYKDEEAFPESKISLQPLTVSEQEDYANIMTAVETFVKETRIKFISGERSFDTWDAYLKELQAMGDIQHAMDIYNSKVIK